jgi:hypothetical protein
MLSLGAFYHFFIFLILQTGLILVPDVVTTVLNLMTAFGLLAVCSLVHSCVVHECKISTDIICLDYFVTRGNNFTRDSSSMEEVQVVQRITFAFVVHICFCPVCSVV